MSIYDKQGQRIFFQRETTYGNIYDPESEIAEWSQVPADYPHPYLHTLLTIKAFEKLDEFKFNKDSIHYFTEDEMSIDIVGWYKSVQANKSGIQITNEMPSKSNIILN